MKFLLYTNICIHFLRGKYGLIEKFEHLGTENFAISEITLAELIFGAESSKNPQKNLDLIPPISFIFHSFEHPPIDRTEFI